MLIFDQASICYIHTYIYIWYIIVLPKCKAPELFCVCLSSWNQGALACGDLLLTRCIWEPAGKSHEARHFQHNDLHSHPPATDFRTKNCATTLHWSKYPESCMLMSLSLHDLISMAESWPAIPRTCWSINSLVGQRPEMKPWSHVRGVSSMPFCELVSIGLFMSCLHTIVMMKMMMMM